MASLVVSAMYVGVLVAKGLTLRWSATALPDRVASHFAASGRPNGWMTRRAYVASSTALAALVLVGVPVLIAVLARHGDAGLNIPNRDFWLRAENHDELVRRLELDGLAIGALTGALLIWVDVAVVRANALSEPRIGRSVWLVVLLFVAALAVGVAYLSIWQFRLPG